MKRNLIALPLIATALVAQTTAYANENKPAHIPLYATSQPNPWSVGVSLLYLQANTTENLNYASIEYTNASGTVTTTENNAINRDFFPGFDVFARYHFHDSARDISVSYMRYYHTDDNSKDISPINPYYIYNNFHFTADGSVNTGVDMVDLTGGQYFNIGKSLLVHLAAGLSYAHIEQTLQIDYDKDLGHLLQPSIRTESYNTNKSQYNGLGPKIGINADYTLAKSEFGFVGGFSAALLMGAANSSSEQEVVVSPSKITYSLVKNDSILASVPNLNANLGVRYRHESSVPVALELGYRVNQFFDAVNGNEDLSLMGVYLTLAASFN